MLKQSHLPQKRKSTQEAQALLAWYDEHRRDLPWRAKQGEHANPYAVWLSEIMLQQTTVETVKPYFSRFLDRWPDVASLAQAEEAELLNQWAGLGYYARARNLHACAKAIMRDYDGIFPSEEADLRALPGIGAYTAAAIASIAFGKIAVVVDGNVERVMTRVYAINTPLPKAKPLIRERLEPLIPPARPGDFAQAMMDLGATICTPRNPVCALCPLNAFCMAHQSGRMMQFPVKPAKKPKPVRYGTAFVAFNAEGGLLLRSRPPRGLLGGMSEVPNTAWEEGKAPAEIPPFPAAWQALNAPVIHIFTHFELRLGVQVARLTHSPPAPDGMRWVSPEALSQEPLPSLMQKILALAQTGRQEEEGQAGTKSLNHKK